MVTVRKGSLTRYAMAVGRVEARIEATVKAVEGGVLTNSLVQLGDWVEAGQALVEVRPILTDGQRLAAKRRLQALREAETSVQEFQQGRNLLGWGMRWFQGGASLDRMLRGAQRSRQDAEAELERLLQGRVEVDGHKLDFLVRAPIGGQVIDVPVSVGEPIVPSSSFGSGTPLMVIADMARPVFRGTVEEVEVARLEAGMAAEITLGARPNESLNGRLSEISLRARRLNQSVVFPIEIEVEVPQTWSLRSGFSAVAKIKIDARENILVIPERMISFRGEQAFVLRLNQQGDPEQREVELGLSDGLTVEILNGLQEGDRIQSPQQ